MFFHKGERECDFIVRERNAPSQAIQVAYSLGADNTKRELQGLVEAIGKFGFGSGTVLTHDQEDLMTVDGKKIIVKPAWKWMTE